MAITYGNKKSRQPNILYTLLAAVLICAVFLSMVSFFYTEAENEAFEMLHIQTKQIKDDLTLQIKSDRENLVTMSHFAAKLYADGENYDKMFASFEPIGLFSNIGILSPDNTFVTKRGSVDLNGKISFDEEVAKGEYISGRIPDLTRDSEEIIRSAVPITVNGETVGILYGVIKLDTISKKYNKMAEEFDAQLFVYDKGTGDYIINTVEGAKGNISSLKNREYNKGYAYEDIIASPNGYSSFKSIRNGQDLYTHYSTIEDFNWGIMLARYEEQVFSKTHIISGVLLVSFLAILLIIVVYVLYLMYSEKRRSVVISYASRTRKLLLDINQYGGNISEALKNVMTFSSSRSAFVVDTDGEDYHYISPEYEESLLSGEERNFFISQLFHYAGELYKLNKTTVGLMCIKPDSHLLKTNEEFYAFLNEHKIEEISFAFVTDKNNHVSLLGVINPQKSRMVMALLEDVAVCFSIALYNKKHLSKTEAAATTDSLTGAMNRVAYKKDILIFDEEKPTDFTCIFIDVNELHMRNNKYGHAAGDEMLIYIANTLKETFYGHYIYRVGGDEFLVFVKSADQEQVKKNIEAFIEQLKITDYNVAIGMSYRKQNTNCEEMVREAEIRMYEAKAQYYQNKEHSSIAKDADKKYIQTRTGIREIDTMLSVLKDHYNGIYRVSLDTDNAHRILMPSYLGYNEDENNFSKLLTKYIDEVVHPDFHRSVMSFLNYDAIKREIAENKTPKITYKKMNGETVILSVYKLGDETENTSDTLWVFAKD